jgi:hypothetical protein
MPYDRLDLIYGPANGTRERNRTQWLHRRRALKGNRGDQHLQFAPSNLAAPLWIFSRT